MKGQTVLVTGATGFLGRRLRKALERAGAKVTPVGHELTERADFDPLRGADWIVHCAAMVRGVTGNLAWGATMFEENMEISLGLLRMVRDVDTANVLYVGTACSYPASAPMPLREEDFWSGRPHITNRCYGEAKRSVITPLESLTNKNGRRLIVPVLPNLFGPGDKSDHVIPDMVRKAVLLRAGAEVDMYGSPGNKRSFLYVDDAAEAILSMMRDPFALDDVGPICNVPGLPPVTMANLWTEVCDLVGVDRADSTEVTWTGTYSGQAERSLDGRRFSERFSTPGQVDLQAGLRKQVRDHLKREGIVE